MKKIFVALMLCIVSIGSFAETTHLRSHALRILQYGTWSVEPNGAGIDIYINDNNVMTIFSDITQNFNMYNVSDVYWKDGFQQFTADAYDKDGVRCGIRVVFRNDSEGPVQIYIRYSNIFYVYNCYLIN